MNKILKNLASVSLLFVGLAAFAQDKTLAYYSTHETEILPDAQEAFRAGDYERSARLCDWFYILTGDNQADEFREKSLKCARLSLKVEVMLEDGQDEAVREAAKALLDINPEDDGVSQYLFAGNKLNGHEWVDLGLSVKWAACNVGASSPDESGVFFAWGETSPASEYGWSTYKWCCGSYDTQTKYVSKRGYGFLDDKTTLEKSDDAARVNWGSTWRLPTATEQEELRKKCIWTWTTEGGKPGYLIKSKVNGNSIFLPASGEREGAGHRGENSLGMYWSSSLSTYDCSDAYYLYFASRLIENSQGKRSDGCSVRPVTK